MRFLHNLRLALLPSERATPLARSRTPRWARWMLAGILSSSAVLYLLDIRSAGFSDFYATGAKSMSISWRALLFGAFDPSATITLDKLSGFLIPQAVSARIFGFSPWALALPQSIEGLITIAAVFWLANRWLGPVGGVISAALMAFTPLLVSMFSHPMEDSMLTMFTVLAVVAWQRSIETDRLRWLVLAGVFVGLGFQAKMMQSWLILPTFALVYFIVGRRPRSGRVVRIALMCVVAIAVSISWMAVISAFPASSRPYIDGTTNNNIFSMVFGYNGVDHFIPGLFPGALPADTTAAGGAASGGSLLIRILGHTPIKLLFPEYATQVGWLYPVVAAGIVLGIRHLRNSRRNPGGDDGQPGNPGGDQRMGIAVLFSLALLITLVGVMGAMSLPHSAYVAALALPLSLLSAIGAILLWDEFRAKTSRWRFALPIVIATETAWTVWLLTSYPTFARWTVVPVLIVGVAATAGLLLIASGRTEVKRLLVPLAAAATAVCIAAPVIWSVSTLNPAFAGNANDAHAGPLNVSVFNPPVRKVASYGTGLNSNRTSPYTATLEDAAYDYAAKHGRKLQYVLATDAWRSASPMIMNEASRVLPVGGFTSRAPSSTSAEIARLVHHGSLRFILLTSTGDKNSSRSTTIAALQTWTRSHCFVVPPLAFDIDGFPTVSGFPDYLYDCGSA